MTNAPLKGYAPVDPIGRPVQGSIYDPQLSSKIDTLSEAINSVASSIRSIDPLIRCTLDMESPQGIGGKGSINPGTQGTFTFKLAGKKVPALKWMIIGGVSETWAVKEIGFNIDMPADLNSPDAYPILGQLFETQVQSISIYNAIVGSTIYIRDLNGAPNPNLTTAHFTLTILAFTNPEYLNFNGSI